MQTFKVHNLEGSIRVDKWLKEFGGLSYVLVQKLIRQGQVKVNGKRVKADHKLVNGDVVEMYANVTERVRAPKRMDKKLYAELAEELKKRVIFKDEHILAINKPYGVATQSGSGIKISIDDVLDELKFDYEMRPRLVHRLDQYTTGVLLLARNREAASLLTKAFKEGLVKKKYLAVVVGKLSKKSGVIDAPVAKFGTVDAKDAITKYKVLSYDVRTGTSLVEFAPLTGRTHQIRIHAAKELGAPIVGDTKYGGKRAIVNSLEKKVYLHSYEVELKHLNGKLYTIKAELPEHMKKCYRTGI